MSIQLAISDYDEAVRAYFATVADIASARSTVAPGAVAGLHDAALNRVLDADAAYVQALDANAAANARQSALAAETQKLTAADEAFAKLAQDSVAIWRDLISATDRARKLISAHEAAVARPLDVAEVLRMAQRLSYTTSAPPGWRPPAPHTPFLPPMPREIEMRNSLLYRTLNAPPGTTGVSFPEHIEDWFVAAPPPRGEDIAAVGTVAEVATAPSESAAPSVAEPPGPAHILEKGWLHRLVGGTATDGGGASAPAAGHAAAIAATADDTARAAAERLRRRLAGEDSDED